MWVETKNSSFKSKLFFTFYHICNSYMQVAIWKIFSIIMPINNALLWFYSNIQNIWWMNFIHDNISILVFIDLFGFSIFVHFANQYFLLFESWLIKHSSMHLCIDSTFRWRWNRRHRLNGRYDGVVFEQVQKRVIIFF